ncbi:hypothetical protein SEVIR_9G219955v4 [Setaria viridis]
MNHGEKPLGSDGQQAVAGRPLLATRPHHTRARAGHRPCGTEQIRGAGRAGNSGDGAGHREAGRAPRPAAGRQGRQASSAACRPGSPLLSARSRGIIPGHETRRRSNRRSSRGQEGKTGLVS